MTEPNTITQRGRAALDRMVRALYRAKGEARVLFTEALEELADRADAFVSQPGTDWPGRAPAEPYSPAEAERRIRAVLERVPTERGP